MGRMSFSCSLAPLLANFSFSFRCPPSLGGGSGGEGGGRRSEAQETSNWPGTVVSREDSVKLRAWEMFNNDIRTAGIILWIFLTRSHHPWQRLTCAQPDVVLCIFMWVAC